MAPYGSIGFVGVGAMGEQMVTNLARKTDPSVFIYINDLNEAVVQRLCTAFENKVVRCPNAREIAERADLTFTMLPEGRHVKEVYLDSSGGILNAKIGGKTFVDCSTIDTASSIEVGKAIREKHPTASFYDAPVSGGVLGAKEATLGIFLGCDECHPDFPRLKTILEMMGNNIIACGGPSLGLVSKLANNYLSGTIAIATAEAMNMGMRAGVNARTLAAVINAGSGRNHIAERFNPVPGICPEAPSSNGYQGGFKLELMRKDMTLAIGMAEAVGAETALASASLRTYNNACADPDCVGLDSRVVYRYLKGNENWE